MRRDPDERFPCKEESSFFVSFLLGKKTGRIGVLTAIATPGLADLVVNVLGGGGCLGLDRLSDDGFPLLHCHDGSIEEGRKEGEEGRGEEWGNRKRKEKRKREKRTTFQVLLSEQSRTRQTHAVFE